MASNIQKLYPGFMSFKTRIECMLKGKLWEWLYHIGPVDALFDC